MFTPVIKKMFTFFKEKQKQKQMSQTQMIRKRKM